MNRVRFLLVLAGVVGVCGVSAASAMACTETWTGTAGDGLWSTATNWNARDRAGHQ